LRAERARTNANDGIPSTSKSYDDDRSTHGCPNESSSLTNPGYINGYLGDYRLSYQR